MFNQIPQSSLIIFFSEVAFAAIAAVGAELKLILSGVLKVNVLFQLLINVTDAYIE